MAGGATSPEGSTLQCWDRTRLGDVVALVDAALPGEGLGADDLEGVLFEPDGVVLGSPDGSGVVAVSVRERFGSTQAAVQLVAVHPEARRLGWGGRLLAAAESWAAGRGAPSLTVGGGAPFYLWPGVDAACTALLCLLEQRGYVRTGAELDMSLPTSFRAPVPAGVRIVRVLDEPAAGGVVRFTERCHPWWTDEVVRAVEHACCLVAEAVDGSVVGFVCHSVNRAGWIGPMATDPDHGRRGTGHALLSAACQDLMVAGYRDAEVVWVGPVGFYAKAGARVSRAFLTYDKTL
ncbi:MAG: GNAT family N-acetyltransferase [Acidimicrobiales bacterium]|jgi:GNAT superfamily N-acetyltransferase|nr:GNAT family N-acetyltransferase [Acidimicrobiales bacterium]